MVTIPILEGMRSDQTRLQKGPKDHKHLSGIQNLWLKLKGWKIPCPRPDQTAMGIKGLKPKSIQLAEGSAKTLPSTTHWEGRQSIKSINMYTMIFHTKSAQNKRSNSNIRLACDQMSRFCQMHLIRRSFCKQHIRGQAIILSECQFARKRICEVRRSVAEEELHLTQEELQSAVHEKKASAFPENSKQPTFWPLRSPVSQLYRGQKK